MVVEIKGVHRRETIRTFQQDLLSPLGMGTESRERPQQVGCCRVVGKTWGLDLEEMRE